MKRLLEEAQSAEPAVRHAAQVLSALTPPPPSPAMRARVRLRLEAPRGRRRLDARWLVAVVLLGAAAAASARLAVPRLWPAEPRAPAAQEPRAERARVVPQPPETVEVVPAESLEPVVPEPAPLTPSVGRQAVVEGRHRVRSGADVTTTPPPPLDYGLTAYARGERGQDAASAGSPPPGVNGGPEHERPSTPLGVNGASPAGPFVAPNPAEEVGTALVVEAVRALRSSGGAVRALALARSYSERFPDGPLVEEALATELRALVAQKDPQAAECAARYLRRFPEGRFAGLARAAGGGR